MDEHAWIAEFPGSVTVCDKDGIILEMNDRSAKTYASDGGYSLIGKNMMACHPASAQAIIKELLETHLQNVYTVEYDTEKLLVYQSPWYGKDELMGLVEFVLQIPKDIPNRLRGSKAEE